MSGLDPLGRREIRELILRLRDRGCTVFFSSHVLSDAETLCSRVAVLAGGRLVAVDELTGVEALRARGWELVVSSLDASVIQRLQAEGRIAGVSTLSARRYAIDVPLDGAPAQVLAELVAAGAEPVSLLPLRDTLEDRFVRQVGSAPKRGAVGKA